MATLHVAAHTCSGITGPWAGAFEITLSAGQMVITGEGKFEFSLPPEGLSVMGEAPFSGSGSVAGSSCSIPAVNDPLRYEITFYPEERRASVVMGSTGQGTLTVVCREMPPITIPFAIAWGPDPLDVPLLPYGDCP